MKKNIIFIIIEIICIILFGIGLNFLILPAWNWQNPAIWGIALLIISIATGIFAILKCTRFIAKIGLVICGCIVLTLLVGGITSSHMFNSKKYQAMIQIEEGDFSKDINPIDNVKNISIVDIKTAERVGDRTIGSIKNSAWYEVDDEYNLIKYNGQQYRISALNYGNFFKYNKAKKDGIPGYILVNTSTQEAQYVELKQAIKYSPSAFFSFDLKRHLREEFSSYIFGKHYFEIDEEGNPYWITAVKRPTIGMFGGQKEESFIITNAVTGENKEYKTEDLPSWVDHAYSLNYLMTATENNLQYINGFWNATFSKTGVIKTTYSYSTEYYNTAITANGDIVFYTGLTPASNAESNVGFILANPRTGKIKRYSCSGAEETSAQASAESLVQDLNYVATFPTILNVNGEETYFMLLKDKAGLVQRYALCNIENYTKVVQASTLEEAVDLYMKKIGNDSIDESKVLSKEGVITEIYQAQIAGFTYYYFKLEEDENIYMSSIENSNKQVFLKKGTNLKIEYIESEEEGVYTVRKIKF